MPFRSRLIPLIFCAVAAFSTPAVVAAPAYAPAASEVRFRITAPSGTITVPLTIKSGTLYVDATVNGKPARFIVDTGAGINVLTPEAARKFGIALDETRSKVVGAATVEARSGIIDRLSIGMAGREAILEKQNAAVAALPEELQCDGLIGGTFLSHWVVTVNYQAARMTLTDRSRFQKPGSATSLPLTMSNGIPAVSASVDNLPGVFRIDTGANDSLTLFGPWVEKNRLRDRYTRRIKTITGQGLGGFLYGELVRVPQFRLGEINLENVIGELSSNDHTSAFYDDKVAGNIGASIWRRFILTLDYPGKRVYLQKNSDFAIPFQSNRSGISASFNQGLMQVIDVIAGSPAAEAGLRVGDTVVALNGIGITTMEPDAARLQLRGEPGTVVALTVRTGDASPRTITLTLRDLL